MNRWMCSIPAINVCWISFGQTQAQPVVIILQPPHHLTTTVVFLLCWLFSLQVKKYIYSWELVWSLQREAGSLWPSPKCPRYIGGQLIQVVVAEYGFTPSFTFWQDYRRKLNFLGRVGSRVSFCQLLPAEETKEGMRPQMSKRTEVNFRLKI